MTLWARPRPPSRGKVGVGCVALARSQIFLVHPKERAVTTRPIQDPPTTENHNTMSNLLTHMDEKTVRLEDTLTTNNEARAVDARRLHAFLENGDEFTHWIKDRIQQYGFVADLDYAEVFGKLPKNSKGGRPTKDYVLTVDMAKELCMVERNAKGKEARLYFIEMERQAKNLAHAVPQSLPEALRLAAELAERAERQAAQIKALEPKARFHDQVSETVDGVCIQDFAKAIGTGRNRFFKWLEENGYIFKGSKHKEPYQRWIEQGIFKLIERSYPDGNGETHVYFKTLVTGKGQIYLTDKFKNQAA